MERMNEWVVNECSLGLFFPQGVWLCNVCRKRRDLMNATTKWRLQQQEDEMSTSVFASRSTSSSAKMFEQLADLVSHSVKQFIIATS